MNVLIAGGGISGSVTAMALQQAGIEATIYEGHQRTDDEAGSYFTISPNGLHALATVGALPLVTAAGIPTRRNVLWGTDGKRLGTPGLGTPLADGTVAQTLKRSSLSNALLREAERRGIAVEYGRRVVDAQVGPDGRVTATFADGGSATGDLLVGADGIHSQVRRAVDRAAPAPRYVGLTNFGGFTPGATVPGDTDAWHMIFGRRAFFGYIAAPGGLVWFVNWPRDQISVEERMATSEAQWREQLAGLFAEDKGPAIQLIREGRLELAGDNTHDLGHVPVWHRGPIVIIGDAAHAPSPTSGQGASMAAEDGVVLAKALRDLPTISAALEAYETARRKRVEKIVAYGARGSSAKMPGRIGRVVRDTMLRFLFRYVVTAKSTAWMYDYRVEWDEPLGPSRAAGIPASRAT